MLPFGTLDNPAWTARSACREAVERVRELYDRGGTAVDGGLEEVVRAVREGTAAAVRAGREALRGRAERLSEENDTLRRQVERLGGQVTRLTESYGTPAEMSRGPWI